MGNNKEIRQRMETYRSILLVFNWIGAIVLLIGGLIMISYKTGGGWSGSSYPLRPYGIAMLIVSILGGIIGHFLVNVGLAIPFILLNNGDILESQKGTIANSIDENVIPLAEKKVPNEEEMKKAINNLPLSEEDMLVALNDFELMDGTAISAASIKKVYKGNYLKYISTVENRYFIETQDGKKGYCFPNNVNKKPV